MTAAGALLFGCYAFPPNRLGYCGPEDHQALLERVAGRHSGAGLVELGRRFEGAYPYLQLIAAANGVQDPFDQRVVEAYWVGNRLLDAVSPRQLHDHLESRFRTRMTSSEFAWLASALDRAPRPHHNFHVFDVYRRAGLMREGRCEALLETMDACRISWGRVEAVVGDSLVVERRPLELSGGKLVLGAPRPVEVARQLKRLGFVEHAAPGDVVALHWDWACSVLEAAARRRLEAETVRAVALANTTL